MYASVSWHWEVQTLANNNENRNEFDKIKDVNSFIKGNVNSLNSNVKSLKGRLTKLTEELTSRRSELKSMLKAQELEETSKVNNETQEVKVIPTEEVKEEPKVEISEETKDTNPEPTNDEPKIEEKVEKKPDTTDNSRDNKTNRRDGDYVRADRDNKNNFPRDNKSKGGYVATGRDNNRDNNRNNGGYRDRNNGDNNGGYRDRNNNGDRNNRAPRPNGAGGDNRFRNNNNRPTMDTEPAYVPTKDTSKKKKPVDKNNNRNDDTNKKNNNMRTLMKKGYVVENFNLDNELDENASVKHHKLKKGKKHDVVREVKQIEHAIVNSDIIPVKTLAEKLGKPAVDLVKKLMELDKMTTVNGTVDFETAELIASDYNITLELQQAKTAEDKLKDIIDINTNEANLVKRPPIVTIMGHVDHGKTSLLDYIRKSHVTTGEAGGITQHIGAYTITVNGEKITFLDTPGHEAFISMRKRGADVTDIAIIVVAADDGIMPQTQEAISHAKAAGVSIIVAINKIDKPDANVDRIKTQLTNYGLVPEEWGGDVIVCPVSAKTGEGVQELLENVVLLADVKELKADPAMPAQGSIIEARLDKGTGPVATVLVQNGTLHVGDFVVAGTSIGKVRAMIDDKNKRQKEAGPSVAVSVLGFSEVPSAGDQLVAVKDEKLAKAVAADRASQERERMQKMSSKKNLEDMFKNMAEGEKKALTVIIKADVQGSVEAVREALEKLSDDMSDEGVKITFPLCGVGAVNESDTMLAETAGAIIIAFNVRPDPKAREYAERNKIEIKYFRVIYDLIETIEKAMRGMLAPTFEEKIIGHAEVREVFNISNVGTIAGSYVLDGKVMRNAQVRFLRDNVVKYEGSISSLKRMKDDVKEVAAGYECGIGLEGISDIQVGDTMEAFIMEKVEK